MVSAEAGRLSRSILTSTGRALSVRGVTTSPPRQHVDELSKVWGAYADAIYQPSSDLYATLARIVASDDQILELVLEAPPHGHDPNMLLAAVHYLVLSGMDHPLAATYREGAAFDTVGPAFRDVCLTRRDDLLSLMAAHHIQTNECGRCPPVALGLAEAALQLGEPLSLVDAGASAGLNLLLDRYRLDYTGRGSLGPADSPVVVATEVRGEGALRLPGEFPGISARLGLDRSPVDLQDEESVRWLLACVWPDSGRLPRTAAAIELARAAPPPVMAGDMVDDLPRAVEQVADGPVAVVTSWSYSYLSQEDRLGFVEALGRIGRERPVAWVCLDSSGVSELFAVPEGRADPAELPNLLGLALWGRDDAAGPPRGRTLALVHPHGRWIEWL